MRKILIFAFLAAVAACRPDPKLPNWEVQALTPFVHSRLEISDLLADSNLSANDSGLMSLVYRSSLAEIKPGQLVPPLDANFQNTIKLQNINLGSPFISDAISLGDLARGGTPAGQFINANHGNSSIIPPVLLGGPKSFLVDATSLFQTVTLQSGDLELSITNEMPVPLSNIDFQLENLASQSLLLQKNIDTLKTNTTFSETFSLAGKTIEGQLKAILVQIESPGSNGDTILIDTSQRVVVTVKLRNLVPLSATAIFPDQILANDTTETTLQAGSALLTKMRVGTGRIFIQAESTIQDQISLKYNIPNARRNSQVLTLDELVPPATSSIYATLFSERDLTGYEVDLTGKPNAFNTYNTFYTWLQGKIDSSGQLISLSLQDSVFLQTGIENLTADRAYGYLGTDTLQASQKTETDAFDFIESGTFDLDEAKLGISIENQIGAPIDFELKNLSSKKSGQEKNLQWVQSQPVTIPKAQLSSSEIPIPSITNLQISKSNGNLDELLELQPDSLKTEISAYLNGSVSSPVFDQFLFSDFGINVYLDAEIPLFFAAQDLLFSDTNSFDLNKIDPKQQWQRGALNLIGENGFPLEFRVEIVMLNAENQRIGELLSQDFIESAAILQDGSPTGLKKSVAKYPVAQEKIALLRETENVVFRVFLSTPLSPQKVKVLQNNFLDLTLSGDLTILTE